MYIAITHGDPMSLDTVARVKIVTESLYLDSALRGQLDRFHALALPLILSEDRRTEVMRSARPYTRSWLVSEALVEHGEQADSWRS